MDASRLQAITFARVAYCMLNNRYRVVIENRQSNFPPCDTFMNAVEEFIFLANAPSAVIHPDESAFGKKLRN